MNLILDKWTEEKSISALMSTDLIQSLLILKKGLLLLLNIIIRDLVKNFMTPEVNHTHLREECLNKSSLLQVVLADLMSNLTNIMDSLVNLLLLFLIHSQAGHLVVNIMRVPPLLLLLLPHLPHNHCPLNRRDPRFLHNNKGALLLLSTSHGTPGCQDQIVQPMVLSPCHTEEWRRVKNNSRNTASPLSIAFNRSSNNRNYHKASNLITSTLSLAPHPLTVSPHTLSTRRTSSSIPLTKHTLPWLHHAPLPLILSSLLAHPTRDHGFMAKSNLVLLEGTFLTSHHLMLCFLRDIIILLNSSIMETLGFIEGYLLMSRGIPLEGHHLQQLMSRDILLNTCRSNSSHLSNSMTPILLPLIITIITRTSFTHMRSTISKGVLEPNSFLLRALDHTMTDTTLNMVILVNPTTLLVQDIQEEEKEEGLNLSGEIHDMNDGEVDLLHLLP